MTTKTLSTFSPLKRRYHGSLSLKKRRHLSSIHQLGDLSLILSKCCSFPTTITIHYQSKSHINFFKESVMMDKQHEDIVNIAYQLRKIADELDERISVRTENNWLISNKHIAFLSDEFNSIEQRKPTTKIVYCLFIVVASFILLTIVFTFLT